MNCDLEVSKRLFKERNSEVSLKRKKPFKEHKKRKTRAVILNLSGVEEMFESKGSS